MENVTVKVKYSRGINPIEKFEIGDWIDLRAAEDVVIKKGECAMIPLGVSMELPKGYEAYLAARSSTFKNFGVLLAIGIGIIDNGYRGEWCFPAYAIRDTEIKKNARIAQFRIIKNQPHVDIEEVEVINMDTERGDGGFGSTGIN